MTPQEIKELRRSLKMTQQTFAEKVGVSITTVASWENGKHSPQPFLVNKLIQIKEEVK